MQTVHALTEKIKCLGFKNTVSLGKALVVCHFKKANFYNSPNVHRSESH